MKDNKIRSKYYTIELYNESENINFNDKIELIKKYDYAYILHNKDNAKEHYHVVVAFANYRYKNAICEEFNIPSNYIEPIRSIEGILTYLIHLNYKSKYQYSIDDVVGSNGLLTKLKKAIKNNGLEEENKVLELIQYIDNSEVITYTRFIKYACSIGRFDVVRRSQYLFTKIIDEHNQNVRMFLDDEKLSWYNERE